MFANPLTAAPYDASRMRKRFKDASARAGLRPLRFHDLRHTFGTRMAAAGVQMRTLQEWMGHRDYKTTSIYADYEPRSHEAGLVVVAFADPLDPVEEIVHIVRKMEPYTLIDLFAGPPPEGLAPKQVVESGGQIYAVPS